MMARDMATVCMPINSYLRRVSCMPTCLAHTSNMFMSHVTCFMSHVNHLGHVTQVNVCRDTWEPGTRGCVCQGNRALLYGQAHTATILQQYSSIVWARDVAHMNGSLHI